MNRFDVEKDINKQIKEKIKYKLLSILETHCSGYWRLGIHSRFIISFFFPRELMGKVLFLNKNVAEVTEQDCNDFIIEKGNMGD